MPEPTLQDLRDRLLELYAQARGVGQHQVAYHVLAAAMHAAESLRDTTSIDRVEEQAREHAGWLDANEPKHPLSAQSAAARGHHSVFEQLAATCAAARARLKAEQLMKEKGRP